jgi:plastocyanin
VLGSGLSVLSYGAVLLISVALFIWYGGPLWATHGSHGMRFAVSYLSVIPLAAIALRVSHRLTWPHLATAVGTLWAFKLLITAPLYYALAPGGALEDIGALPTARTSTTAPPSATTHTKSTRYEPAAEQVATGTIKGTVKRGKAPAERAVVMIEQPRPGKALAAGTEHTIKLVDGGFERHMHLMTTNDTVRIVSSSSRMHAVKIKDGPHARLSAPVPPSGQTKDLEIEKPGVLSVICTTHAEETAVLVVVDHPYAVLTDADGAFTLEDVPVGKVEITVYSVDENGKVSRHSQSTKVSEGAVAELQLQLVNNN